MRSWLRVAAVAVAVGIIFTSIGVASETDKDRGPVLAVDFSGSSSDPAWIYKLNVATGYKFSKHFELDFGIPAYFVHVPAGNVDGYTSKNGIGNVYIDPKLMLSHGNFSFVTDIRATAPTGNRDYGFSSGRATVDWSNYFDVSIGKFTPFASAGLANTVSDTNFFTRPFSSLGVVGHLEGGFSIAPIHWVTLTGSAYSILPSGGQTIVSKLISRPAVADGSANTTVNTSMNTGMNLRAALDAGSTATSYGNGNAAGHNRVFETVTEVVGDSSLAKDHGFSGWIDINPSSKITLQAGYTRSVAYAYNSVFFSLHFDFASVLRRDR